MELVEIAIASAVPIVLIGGFINRCIVTHENDNGNILRGRGIGWQFIRFCVLTTGLPIVGLLALRGVVTGEAALAFIAAGVGYAFGKVGKN